MFKTLLSLSLIGWMSCGGLAVAAAVPDETPHDNVASAGWTEFRGPQGQGHGSRGSLPTEWSESKGIAWKVKIEGLGWSSPAIRDHKIWLTTATDSGHSLKALCLDEETGQTLLNIEVFHKSNPGKIHSKNSHATPTPLLIGERVYVHFGAHGTACLSTSGEILWKTELSYYHHHGPSASPVLAGGQLIIPCDGFKESFYDKLIRPDVSAFQFVAALNPDDGKLTWKRSRNGQHSYATPLAIEVGGAVQVVSPGGNKVIAYDPVTGAEIWSCRYGKGYSVVPRPVFGNGLVYVCTGYDSASLLAIRPDGKGDITDTHVAWKVNQGVPFNPSPLLIDDDLYLVSDGGVASCLNAQTGAKRWQARLGGNFSASPIYAGGNLYFLNETGVTYVVQPGPKFKRLAVNKLNGRTLASPAVSRHALYLRTDRHLYRIEDQTSDAADP